MGGGANFGNANIFTAIVTSSHPMFDLVHSELVKIQNGKLCTNISHTLLAILNFDGRVGHVLIQGGQLAGYGPPPPDQVCGI